MFFFSYLFIPTFSFINGENIPVQQLTRLLYFLYHLIGHIIGNVPKIR